MTKSTIGMGYLDCQICAFYSCLFLILQLLYALLLKSKSVYGKVGEEFGIVLVLLIITWTLFSLVVLGLGVHLSVMGSKLCIPMSS